ncbi:MAG: MFS transporter, partial [Dehalococcoidia bacterium]|nr:MFS transporter [Dehalococcoidia bacterium]
MVGISGFVMTVATVPFFHALGIWSVALESHFAWTRTQLFIAFVLSRIEGGIMGPLEGYLTDRLGARRMVLIGLLILGAGFLLFSRVENLWMFYASFMIMALGVGLGGWLPLMTVVNNWFIRRRSSAMGWASVLSRLGALLLVPAIAWAVDPDADRLGWQTTAVIIGAIKLLSALGIPRFIRNRPEEYGQRPDGDEAPTPAPASSEQSPQSTASSQEVDFTARQALRTPAFYCISFGHAF